MEKIEVSVISKHTIRPSTSTSHLQPYKLTLLDQLIPPMYLPITFFYPITNPTFNLPQTLAELRSALSEALTLYYPLSGRVKNNICINDFDSGVPYFEARVKCDMTDFLRCPKIECLNMFVPMKPYSMEVVSEGDYPLFGVQVNVFHNGIAIGVCTSHKLMDGRTSDCFLTTWGAIFRGFRDEIVYPSLSEAAVVFPPRDDLPEKYASLVEGIWFQRKVVTRRFVFDEKAICALQDEAMSESVPKPSRVQAVVGFIWKHLIAASQASIKGSTCTPTTSLSIAIQAVNIRSRLNMEATLDNATGNLLWWAPAMLELNHTTQEINNLKLSNFVTFLNKSIEECNNDCFEKFKGKEGYGGLSEYLDHQVIMKSMKPAPEVYSFSSWTRFFDKVDFGWGRAAWIGTKGKIEDMYYNSTCLVPTQCYSGIEAWVNIDEKKMGMLEQDPSFLALTSPNPPVFKL